MAEDKSNKKSKKKNKKPKPIYKLAHKAKNAVLKERLESDQDVDIDCSDDNGMTGLMWASACGYTATVDLLLEHKAGCDKQNNDGWTSMMCAALRSHSDCVDKLIEAKADPNLFNSEGKSALMCACVMMFNDIADDGKRAEAQAKNVTIIKRLLEHNADINHKDQDNTASLMWACAKNNYGAVEALLGNRELPDIRARNEDALTSLMWACQQGNSKMARLLIDHKASVAAMDTDGWTPLIWASKKMAGMQIPEVTSDSTPEQIVEIEALKRKQEEESKVRTRGMVECIEVLLEHKADIDHQDSLGKTALIWASESGNRESSEVLMIYEADAGILDKEGNRADSLATDPFIFKLVHKDADSSEGCQEGCECVVC